MTKTTMDLGRVGIWTGALDGRSSAEAAEVALLIESIGFRTLWIPETIGRDPFVTAALLLERTSTLQLATGIANIYARDAVTTANLQRTLEEAFPGRFLLGLGVSHAHLVDRVRHHDYSKPYSRMVEYLDAMGSAVFRGVGPADLPPATVLAALGPRMLALAAAEANGAHPYLVPVEHTALARQVMGPDATLAPEQMVVLDTDPVSARRTARANVAVYLRAPNYVANLKRFGFTDDDVADGGSDRLVDAIVAWGDIDAVAARVAAHHDAGADHVAVQLLSADGLALPESQLRELGAALLGPATGATRR